MTKREADELTLIEDAITIDPVAKKAWFRYPMIKTRRFYRTIARR